MISDFKHDWKTAQKTILDVFTFSDQRLKTRMNCCTSYWIFNVLWSAFCIYFKKSADLSSVYLPIIAQFQAQQSKWVHTEGKNGISFLLNRKNLYTVCGVSHAGGYFYRISNEDTTLKNDICGYIQYLWEPVRMSGMEYNYQLLKVVDHRSRRMCLIGDLVEPVESTHFASGILRSLLRFRRRGDILHWMLYGKC